MTVSGDVREQVLAKFKNCSECGRPMMSMQRAAKEIGTTYQTLRAFTAGKSVNSSTLDKIARWADGKAK